MQNKSNLARGIIGFLLGALIIFGALQMSKKIIANKAKPKIKAEKQINTVYTQLVQNEDLPISIIEKGNLVALKKVDLFSEVQGLLKDSNKLFKSGQTYNKGDLIFSIDDSEFKANLTSQRAVLYNLIVQSMPDLKLDYSEVFEKWESYLKAFDIKKITPVLPEFTNDKEKYFINSRNIVTTYYNIKNLEERHKKYNIYAPFYGIVTQSMVNPGALIRTGQNLGTIMSPYSYELPISVNVSYKEFIKKGSQVQLYNLERTKQWTGRIARIDGAINTVTQGIQIYIEVSGKDLKEGMFLEAHIDAGKVDSSFEISRKLLVENNKTYVVQDSILKLIPLDIAYYKESSAVVTNLEEGSMILEFPIPGAYEGMLIEVAQSSQE